MTSPHLNRLGCITSGQEVGRFVEVLDDSENTGGFLIFTYQDAQRSPEVFDAWVETWPDVGSYFREAEWEVEWQGPEITWGDAVLVHPDASPEQRPGSVASVVAISDSGGRHYTIEFEDGSDVEVSSDVISPVDPARAA